ncbi:ABC transporter substrate-binding protein [Novipirellula artificiosorum]|uniref:Extracellular solute-binding protein n=1 Tax=Novipirellula artificiosorum TaxID=2528016 RepID=A0A5C6DFK4_9BACT|nr:ABC transporter substrate-binding protein [Novipirellula artificiosorum]TWU34511.1 Extracellular solute-binding protein [Novipirellula artificiosorum]
MTFHCNLTNRIAKRRRLQMAWLVATLAIGVVQALPASAQIINYAESGVPDRVGLELLQEDPHDLIFFTEKAGGGWVKARLLDLPQRRMPRNPKGSLRFDIVGLDTKSFTAKWEEIEKIDFWEVRLERETDDLIAKGDFQGAFPFLSVLIRDYPERPGLRKLRSEFLWKDAIKRAKEGDFEATLAMLEELRRYAPEYQSDAVLRALSGVTDRLMAKLVEQDRLELAQQMLSRLEKEYPTDKLTSIGKWSRTFQQMAEEKRDAAIQARDAKDYRLARTLARESIAVKPDIVGGQALVREIDQIYPLVRVGVLQSATVLDPTRIDNWASRRAGRLVYRTLFEVQGAGPEGGEYEFIFGDTEMTPDRRQLDLMIEPEKLEDPLNRIEGYYLADVLTERAQRHSPDYFSAWAAAVEAIGLDGPKQIQCLLRRSHVLPTCLLQIPVDGSWVGGKPGDPTGAYRRDETSDDLVRYVLARKPKDDQQIKEIVEIRTASASDGVSLLLQGELDVLDQLFPADAVRLRKSRDIRVQNYPLPTVHMLVPCSDHPYIAEPTFRRALLYGINRQDILQGELLEGLESPGCQVVSGPFPAGIEPDDPLGYAYDREILPRNYEPRLAKLLITVNESQMKGSAEVKKEELPAMTPLRLAFPADNLSRVACEAISTQWQLLGLEVELVELPVGRTYPDPDTADLVYVSAAVWEPIIDARRLLGPKGLAGSEDQLVGLGLRRLEEARNWREVRDQLLILHFIANNELPILPLWQMVDSYAYRRNLLGIGRDIVSLYQNAGKWRWQ